jgi:hypothetical protein
MLGATGVGWERKGGFAQKFMRSGRQDTSSSRVTSTMKLRIICAHSS